MSESDRVWDGGIGPDAARTYILEWSDSGVIHGWDSDDLEHVLAKRAGILPEADGGTVRVVAVTSFSRHAAIEAWKLGHLTGKQDLNYEVRDHAVRGVRGYMEIPV